MTETTNCPRCGAPIPAGGSPGGLCPRCLLQAGMESKGSAADIVHTGLSDSSRKPPPTREELAQHFPQFEIGELLGQGGMGAVFRARQKGLDRDVALKVLTVDTEADPRFAERFGREAKTLARLAHPSIVHVYDVGRAGPWYFLAMELVEGVNLRQMMRAKTVGPRESMSIVAQMCDALQYAHDEGVVHRDIKPENVLVGRKGNVKILDFGLAKILRRGGPDPLTKTQQVMGTPYYMAPEQWERPLEVDHRADIYSLGVVFYELLTGELPVGRFAAPSKKVEIDVRLDDVVVKTLEKEPELRYQHVSQVKTDVDRIAAGPPVMSHPAVGAGAAAGAAGNRRAWPWIAVAAAVALLFLVPLAVALLLALRYRQSASQTAEAILNTPPLVPDAPPPAPMFGSVTTPGEATWRLDEETAATMGIPEGELERVNDILGAAEHDYRQLEVNRARVEEVSPGQFTVELGSLGPEAQELRTTLMRDLAPLVRDPTKRIELFQMLDETGPLLSGDGSKRIEIMRVPKGYRVVERSGDSESPHTVREWKTLPPEYQKILDALPTPPVAPAPVAPPK